MQSAQLILGMIFFFKGKKTLKKPSVFYECTFDIIRRVRGGLGRSECGYRSSPGPRQGDRCPTRDVLRLS